MKKQRHINCFFKRRGVRIRALIFNSPKQFWIYCKVLIYTITFKPFKSSFKKFNLRNTANALCLMTKMSLDLVFKSNKTTKKF